MPNPIPGLNLAMFHARVSELWLSELKKLNARQQAILAEDDEVELEVNTSMILNAEAEQKSAYMNYQYEIEKASKNL